MSEAIPKGLCQCGCGQATKIATKTNTRLGHVKGQPINYIQHHHLYDIAKKKFIHLDKDLLKSLYLDKGLSLQGIASTLQVSTSKVKRSTQKLGIPKQDRLKATRNKHKEQSSIQIKHSLNQDFFDSMTNEAAWVLGVLATDGHLYESRNLYRAALSMCDKDVIEKIKCCLECSSPIRVKRRKGKNHKDQYSLDFSLYNTSKIIKYIPSGHKTWIVPFPDIAPRFTPHFIRGCWDGDGSIIFRKRNNKEYLRMSFVSGSSNLINGISKALKEYLGLIVTPNKNKNIMCIDIGHQKSMVLGEWLYKDSEGIRMERKYENYLLGSQIQLSNNWKFDSFSKYKEAS